MSERYDVQLSKAAVKALKKLDRQMQDRILKALSLLRADPRPPTTKPLVAHAGYLRVRVGDYRIIYTVHDDVLTVLVLKIGHRSEIYRSLT